MVKYIIIATFPSGSRWAFAAFKEQFALVPIMDGVVRKALAWDSAQDAQRHLNEQLEAAPELERMGPFSIEMMEVPN